MTKLDWASAQLGQTSREGEESNQGTYRPPMKCRPLKCLTSGLGAVRLTRTSGKKLLPTPDFGGPSAISHEDGASTEVTGTFDLARASITAGNGSRTSPEKLKPTVIGSADEGIERRESEGGTNRIWHPRHDQSTPWQRGSHRQRESLGHAVAWPGATNTN